MSHSSLSSGQESRDQVESAAQPRWPAWMDIPLTILITLGLGFAVTATTTWMASYDVPWSAPITFIDGKNLPSIPSYLAAPAYAGKVS